MGSEVVIGILSVVATIVAALLQRSWRLNRPRLPRHEPLEFGAVREQGSFSAIDVVKILDLDQPGPTGPDQPGRAVYTDSYLMRRETGGGNGAVFRYACSGGLDGRCISHTDRQVIEPYTSTHFATSRAITVPLDHVGEGNCVRITNQLTYLGSFDRPDDEDFETHVERPTRSLTIMVRFSGTRVCQLAVGQVQVGERGRTVTTGAEGPVLTRDGRLLYWRVFPAKGDWLPIGAKYRLQWNWGGVPAGQAPVAQEEAP